jgi:predicted  nucleic acid-binding Zn-ribbon protein
MRQEYSFDKIIQYAVDEIDGNIRVVNREYSNIESQIKKSRDKLVRINANLYDILQKHPDEKEASDNNNGKNKKSDNDDNNKKKSKWFTNQLEMLEQKKNIENKINTLIEKRKNTPYKIPVSEMSVENRYSKLNQESNI